MTHFANDTFGQPAACIIKPHTLFTLTPRFIKNLRHKLIHCTVQVSY